MSAAPREPAAAWLSLGGNIGPVERNFRAALEDLDALPSTRLAAVSSLYRTPPWGDEDQPPFLNAVARLDTSLDAPRLLAAMQDIETRLGRRREAGRRWGPRAIDLDLLLAGDQRSGDDVLTLPHPRMHERVFVLLPLIELAPDLHIPGIGAAADCLSSLDVAGIETVAGPGWWRHS